MPIVYRDSSTGADTLPYSEYDAYRLLSAGTRPAPTVVCAEDTQNAPYTYSNITPAWSPAASIDPILGTEHYENRVIYGSFNGEPYSAVNGVAFTDIWSTELIDFTPPFLESLPSVTPRQTTAGQPVVISAQIADGNAGVAHVWVQIKNPNSYLQDTRLPSLRNSIAGTNVSLTYPYDVPDFTSSVIVNVPKNTYSIGDPCRPAGDSIPVVFDGHRIYQVTSLGNPTTDTGEKTVYHTYNEIGSQPINPAGAPDPNAYNYADFGQENIPFDMYTMFGQGVATSVFQSPSLTGLPAGQTQNYQPPDTLELTQDPTDPSGQTYSTTWTTDPTIDTDYIIDIIAVDRLGNAMDYDNVWGFSTKNFPTGSSSVLLVADYTSPQQFLRVHGSQSYGPMFGAESALTDNPLSKIGTDPNSGGDQIPPISVGNTVTNNVNLLNLVEPAGTDLVAAANGTTMQPNFLWGFANTLGSGSWVNLIENGGTTLNWYLRIYNGGNVPNPTGFNLGPIQVNAEMGWPAAESSFNPNTNVDSYDIWRVLCRGLIPQPVLNAYGPVTVLEPDPADVTKQDARETHPKCVVWASPFSGDELVGPGTILDTNAQAEIGSFLDAGGHLFLTGQDIAWALSLDGASVPGNTTVKPFLGPDFLKNYFGVQYLHDRTLPLGDNVNSAGGGLNSAADPIGSRFTPTLTPLIAMAHYFTGNPGGLATEYNVPSGLSILQFAAHIDDYPDNIINPVGGGLQLTPGFPAGATDTVASDYTQATG